MSEIITFQSFDTMEEAVKLSVLLLEKGVANRIQKSRPTLINQIITGDTIPEAFHIQIDEDDLTKAQNIIDNL